MIRAVATDVDGTITDNNSLMNISAVDAIRELEAKGIKVMLCSGNALCVLKALARYIGCTGPTIAENGAIIEYKGKMKIVGEKGKAKKIIQELKSIYGEKVKETWSNNYRYVDASILRTIPFEDVQKIVRQFNGFKVIDSGFAFHVLDEKVDKGVGTKIAANWAQIDISELAGVGDSITDLELLKASGYKCAVLNGHPAIKEIADFVSSKKHGDGFTEIAKQILKTNASGWNEKEPQ